jgi:hypothetical protein
MAVETLGVDTNGKVDFSLPLATAGGNIELTEAGGAKSFTTPANYNRIFLTYTPGVDVFVAFNGETPALPTSTVTNTVSQEQNPAGRQILYAGGQVITMIANATVNVSWRFDLSESTHLSV